MIFEEFEVGSPKVGKMRVFGDYDYDYDYDYNYDWVSLFFIDDSNPSEIDNSAYGPWTTAHTVHSLALDYVSSQSFSKTFRFHQPIQKYLIVIRSTSGQVTKICSRLY